MPEPTAGYLYELRQGRKVGKTLYLVDTRSEDRDSDRLVGYIEDEALAARIVEAFNNRRLSKTADDG